jgi:uncharacterized SAM-dependent methyltransferase
LVDERKKYRNSRTAREVSPTDEFYKIYNNRQVLDIIANLDAYREIPRQYNYFDQGAHYWDEYTKKLSLDEAPNLLTATIKLLEANQGYLDFVLGPYSRVNVVDVGVGNAMPVRGLLERLKDRGKLGRYIAIDISPEMLRIAKHNVESWFGDRVSFEGHELDITQDRFSHLLAEEYIRDDADKTANLILLLGSTICNFRSPQDPLRVMLNSMGRRDLMILGQKLDTVQSRRFFDFNSSPQNTPLTTNHRLLFNLLNIDPSFYKAEMGFDAATRQRYIRARMTMSLRLKFYLENKERVVEVEKGETILLWRHWQQSSLDVSNELLQSHLYPVHVSQTQDREYILAIAAINPNVTV